MNTLKFKTTIKCSGCLANVTPHLNAAEGIEKWEVDIMNPNKILIVETAGASEGDVIAAVEKAGYTAEKVS
ncbi:heavy-metal-associated domain-containing protein [Ekhidna sp.]|uniref:heavy-metal-associated domain-containing protein n=1 Tax=Ekhidna sp. TaxID=2608089 RepID=UPI003B50681E